jgi:hypothetical protein
LPFGAVVARNWAAWSGGRGAVSKDDLVSAISRPECRGEDAAALAALEYWARRNGPVDRTTAVALADPKVLKRYRTGVAKLRSTSRVLFASGGPVFSRLQQGPAGDCYFFSGAGWIARYRPRIIVQAIAPLPDGRSQVTFPNGDAATVTPPTDGEMAANDSASTLAIDVPDGPKPIVERFTGRRATGHHLGARARHAEVREALTRMHDRRLMAEVLLLHRPAAKLVWDHVYAVLDFEPEGNTVVLWNPWGTDLQPKGPSGPKNGYARVHGIFRIPLDEFVRFFTFLAIEDG